MANFLFLAVLALIPVQLNKYFFITPSFVLGIPVDYRAISFYLSDILTFLGAESDFTPRDASELVNSGKGERIPAVLEREIAALLLPETEELNRRFANTYTQRWLAHARKASA